MCVCVSVCLYTLDNIINHNSYVPFFFRPDNMRTEVNMIPPFPVGLWSMSGTAQTSTEKQPTTSTATAGLRPHLVSSVWPPPWTLCRSSTRRRSRVTITSSSSASRPRAPSQSVENGMPMKSKISKKVERRMNTSPYHSPWFSRALRWRAISNNQRARARIPSRNPHLSSRISTWYKKKKERWKINIEFPLWTIFSLLRLVFSFSIGFSYLLANLSLISFHCEDDIRTVTKVWSNTGLYRLKR